MQLQHFIFYTNWLQIFFFNAIHWAGNNDDNWFRGKLITRNISHFLCIVLLVYLFSFSHLVCFILIFVFQCVWSTQVFFFSASKFNFKQGGTFQLTQSLYIFSIPLQWYWCYSTHLQFHTSLRSSRSFFALKFVRIQFGYGCHNFHMCTHQLYYFSCVQLQLWRSQFHVSLYLLIYIEKMFVKWAKKKSKKSQKKINAPNFTWIEYDYTLYMW